MELNWQAIDIVLLDMDGTLLDLHFDNFFWLTHLPQRYAEHHGICPDEATTLLHRRFSEKQGTLDWYCLEYWSGELSLDIRGLKDELRHLIRERPFVQAFLSKLQQAGIERVLITNAHPQSLELKLEVTGIQNQLDRIISSHQFGEPKESQRFWQQLRQQLHFDPARALFIDDSQPVLKAARDFGIGHLVTIRQPDSQRPPRADSPFPAIDHFDEILPTPP